MKKTGKFKTLYGFIRLLRSEERRFIKLADKCPGQTEKDKWMRGWLDGTANAIGWAADGCSGLRKHTRR